MKRLFRYGTMVIHGLIAFLLMTLMLITTIDVIGRYLFNSPLPGSTELTEFCLGLLIFSTLPVICKTNQHISVDLLEERFSPRFKVWSDLLMQGVLFIGMGAFVYGMYLLMKRAQRDELVSEILLLPIDFFYLVITILILFSMIGVLVHIFSLLRKKT